MTDLLTIWVALLFAFLVGCWVGLRCYEKDQKKRRQLSRERLAARRRRMGLD